jgi:hypothetical protein
MKWIGVQEKIGLGCARQNNVVENASDEKKKAEVCSD